MQIKSRDVAPDFEFEDLEGRTRAIAHYRGRTLLLQFYRYASCPMCNLRLHDLTREYRPLNEMGLEVIAFFHSSPKKLRAQFDRRVLPFPIVADPSRRLYRAFGVKTSIVRFLLSMLKPRFYWDWLRSMRHGFFGGMGWPLTSMPADFLVGPDGIILQAHYGRDIGDHISVHDIKQTLSNLEVSSLKVTGPPKRDVTNQHRSESALSSPALIMWTLVWAIALISSSYFLKGFAFGEWVDALLYLAAGVGICCYMLCTPALRCAKNVIQIGARR